MTDLQNFRNGPTDGLWIERGAGAYGYLLPYTGSMPSSIMAVNLPDTMTWESNAAGPGSWSNERGIERPDGGVIANYLYHPSEPLHVSFTSDVDYQGVLSLYWVQGPGENRSYNVTISSTYFGGVLFYDLIEGGNSFDFPNGRFYEFDATIDAGDTLVILMEGGVPNNTLSGVFFSEPTSVAELLVWNGLSEAAAPVTMWNGFEEVPVALSVWDGLGERPFTSETGGGHGGGGR